jgi:hypothetical protein
VLTAEQSRFWAENGYLVLPGFYAAADLDPLRRLVERVWADPPGYLVVDKLRDGQRVRLADLPVADRAERLLKLNDLYLEEEAVRRVALADRLVPVLAELLGDPPVLCNSLNFEKGSMQPAHVDSLFMTPRTPGKLVATWAALEDTHPDAGQLFYYPGSHLIPRYAFSDGSHHAVPGEMPDWHRYIDGRIEAAGLRREQFAARAGDLLVWHADLVHGGSAIRDGSRTRQSLVCHYFARSDCRAQRYDCVPYGSAGGFWRRRPHVPLPGATSAAGGPRASVGRWLRRVGLYHPLQRLTAVVGPR